MNRTPASDHSLLIFLLALFVTNSPLNHWWTNTNLPWYSLYVVWLVVIALLAVNQLRQKGGD
ncbi:MAG: hypothetical protein AB8B63_01050 [Granulosicoccus sp.]